MMNEHTELPWKVTQYHDNESLICIDSTIPDANGITHQICGLEKGKAASDFLEITRHLVNAEFIVRACNSHKDLLAACEEIAERTKSGNPRKEFLLDLIQEVAEAAITKAGVK